MTLPTTALSQANIGLYAVPKVCTAYASAVIEKTSSVGLDTACNGLASQQPLGSPLRTFVAQINMRAAQNRGETAQDPTLARNIAAATGCEKVIPMTNEVFQGPLATTRSCAYNNKGTVAVVTVNGRSTVVVPNTNGRLDSFLKKCP